MSSDSSARQTLFEQLADEVRAAQRSTDQVDELLAELLGINRTDSRCLDILDQHGRMTAGALAEASGLTSGAITAVIDRLERAGYAHRVADPSDRRRVFVELTPRTRELSWELMGKPMTDAVVPMMEGYSDEQLKLLIDFQRRSREFQERHADWLRARLKGS